VGGRLEEGRWRGALKTLYIIGTHGEGAPQRGQSKVSETLARKQGSAGRSKGTETLQHLGEVERAETCDHT
jgi:hypothetical protein